VQTRSHRERLEREHGSKALCKTKWVITFAIALGNERLPCPAQVNLGAYGLVKESSDRRGGREIFIFV
jgi:hypothetical protein